MIHEKSCGAVIWRKPLAKPLEYLILQHRAGHWAFAKGHVENNETEHETASREIMEETGLNVSFHPSFRETTSYSPRAQVEKTVVYFLAEAPREASLELQAEEISQGLWLPYDKAIKHLSYPNDQAILRPDHDCLAREKI